MRWVLVFGVACLALIGSAQTVADKKLEEAIARSANPQRADEKTIREAGDKAFRLLLPKVQRRIEMEKKGRSPGDAFLNQVRLLCACATEKRTPEMTKLYQVTSGYERQSLFSWLTRTGNLQVNRSLFERLVQARAGPRRFWQDQESAAAVAGLLRIGDAKAVALLARVLLDDKALGSVRRGIFTRLAGTGSAVALDALRRARQGSRERRLMPEQVVEAERSPWALEGIPATHRDIRGTTWGLIYMDALGSTQDLWLVKKQGGRWVDPSFTGVSTHWPRSHPGGGPTDGHEEHEATMAKLIQGGGWTRQFVGNVELTRDTDADGLTDVVEQWLALDPANPDSDGDGLKDPGDKNPLSAQRTLNETEQILLAALEACVCGRDDLGKNLFVTFPEGVAPFEITCGPRLVLPGERKPTRANALFGSSIRFGGRGKPAVHMPRAGIAEVSVTEDGGWYASGYVVVLKKFGTEWFPIGTRSVWSAVS